MVMNRKLEKDLVYYTVRWMVFGAIAGFFAPVVSNGIVHVNEFDIKFHHLLEGLLFGLACGYAFTLSQNKFNSNRNKKVTWSLVAALWFGFNVAFAGISMM
ncbi:MAG: hypothetical protein HKL98_08410 [Burkholderiales bacterium]|nr:hypothetical protein [Burkholderiales bacterium]